MAFYDTAEADLRLYLLANPTSTELRGVQQILAERLEDVVFFQHGQRLHMALALQLGHSQYANDIGMQCV